MSAPPSATESDAGLPARRDSAWRCALAVSALLLALGWSGCSPVSESRDDDHPMINEALARKSVSPRDAVRLLEKALEANPRLARAHWELGLLNLQSVSNYAASAYHFQKLLDLRPDWPQASTASNLIRAAQIELVRDGLEPPSLPSAQRQIDRLVQELHELTAAKTNLQARVAQLTVVTQQLAAENAQLRQQLAFASAQVSPPVRPPAYTDIASRPLPPTNAPPARYTAPLTNTARGVAPSPFARASSTNNRPVLSQGVNRSPAPAASPAPRTYTMKRGDTIAAVARRHNLTIRDIVNANPGLDPSRVTAGRTIRLPGR